LTLISAFVLGTAAGCGDPFRSVSELDETPQVLAVRAEPPELGPGEEVTLDALVHWPGGQPLLFWLVCIPNIGESFTTCLQNQFGQLAEPPSCQAEPGARFCVAGVGPSATYRVPQGVFPDDGETHTFFVNMLATSGVEGLEGCAETLSGGAPSEDCLLSLKRVVVTYSDGRNVNPLVSHMTLDGSALAPGQAALVEQAGAGTDDLAFEIGVALDPASVDELFPQGEPPLEFTLVVSWFTDCGRLGVESSFLACWPEVDGGGPGCETPEVRWKPGSSGLCSVHAVVRDGRGGTGFLTQEFEIR
jgi:hypothetical protein